MELNKTYVRSFSHGREEMRQAPWHFITVKQLLKIGMRTPKENILPTGSDEAAQGSKKVAAPHMCDVPQLCSKLQVITNECA